MNICLKNGLIHQEKELKRAKVIVDQVLALEETFKNYSDETLKK